MGANPDFRDYVLDLLAPLGPVSARAMFGGHGLYHRAGIFAILKDGALFLKADASLRPDFEAHGFAPFRPKVKGRPFPMPYYEVPPELLEDGDALLAWARKSLEAAARAGPPARRRKGRARGAPR